MKVGDVIRWKRQKKIVGIIVKVEQGSVDILSHTGKIISRLSPASFEVINEKR